MHRLFTVYKTLTLWLLFIFLFSVTVSFGAPLYNSTNTTLNPQCAPTDPDCRVSQLITVENGGTGATTLSDARAGLGLSYSTANDVTGMTHIATWGDSLTAGAGGTPYPTQLSKLENIYVYNGGFPGQNSVGISARMLAATDKYQWSTIIWVGRNNINAPAQVKSDIAAMVAALGHQRYLVLSIINGSGESVGTANYNAITQLNSDLAAIYGDHFVDVRTALVSQYDPAISQDVIDYGNDVPPSSLRADWVHLNTAGYEVVTSQIRLKKSFLFSGINTDSVITLGTVNNILANQFVDGTIRVNGVQTVYVPDQDDFLGSVYFGDGGASSSHTTGQEGQQNTGVGMGALLASTTGYLNTSVGAYSLFSNTSGASNVAIGAQSLYANSTGTNNTAVGTQSLIGNTTGANSVAVGFQSLSGNTTGSANTGVGMYALALNTTGTNNSSLGFQSLLLNTTGSRNIAFGYQSGYGITTGSNNIILGSYVDAPTATASGQLNIGNTIYGLNLYTGTSLSSTATATGSIGIGLTTPTARLHLPAGTSTASRAPLKFTAGINLATTEAGAIEYDGTHLYFTATNGGTRYQLDQQGGGVSIGGSISSATQGSILYAGASGVLSQDNANFFWDATNRRLGIGTNTPSSVLTLAGDRTASAWGVNGLNFRTMVATYTDSSSSGTVATNAINSFAIPVLAASSATTYTTAANVYIAGPAQAGANVTLAKTLALQVALGDVSFAGGLGLGTTTPSSRLDVVGPSGVTAFTGQTRLGAVIRGATGTTDYSGIDFITAAFSIDKPGARIAMIGTGAGTSLQFGTTNGYSSGITNTALTIDPAGRLGISNTAPGYLLHVGSASTTTGTTVTRFQNAGGTCDVIPSTSGGITCSSDYNLKKNIITLSNTPWVYQTNTTDPTTLSILQKVLLLQPVQYNWNVESDTDTKHAGFIAQDVQQLFPELVTIDPATNLLSLNYTGLLPYTIQALQDINITITTLADTTKTNSLRDSLIAWLGSAGNGIKKVTADEFCIDDLCITKEQLRVMLQNNMTTQTQSIAPVTVTEAPAEEVLPVVVKEEVSTEEPEVEIPQEEEVSVIAPVEETVVQE